jgi:hypothetical protein
MIGRKRAMIGLKRAMSDLKRAMTEAPQLPPQPAPPAHISYTPRVKLPHTDMVV